MTYSRATRAASTRALALICGLAAAGPLSSQEDTGARSFELGGMHRVRYETLDPQFRAGFSNSDQALALRTAVTLDWRRDGLRVFGEIMDSRTELDDSGSLANTTTANALEPLQAFVEWRNNASTWRFGKVTQDLGKRRLMARNQFRNTVNTFTGIDWAWNGENDRAAHAFYWVPMRMLPSDLESVLDSEIELDRGTRDSSLKGLFYQFPRFSGGKRLEAYVFDFELDPPSDPAAAANHVSVGARAYRPPQAGEWSYEVEAVLQRGESGGTIGNSAPADLNHRAAFLHLELGYAFDLPSSPVLLLQYDYASGDSDPDDARNERFFTLFGSRRFDFSPTGIYGIVARGNLSSPGMRMTFQPAPRWQAMLSYRSLALAAARDGWIGAGWRDASGAAGRSIGRHLEGSFTWTAIPDRLSIETGFAHLWAGRFAKQTAGAAFRGDAQYFYAALTTNF